MLNLEAGGSGSGADQATEPTPHRTTITERGSFATAHCRCGWRGPARRARDRARQDASAHVDR